MTEQKVDSAPFDPPSAGHDAQKPTSRKSAWRFAPAIVVACFFLICSGITGLAIADMMRVQRGEHVERVDWLPESATDVCFYKAYPYSVYEFSISEDEFRKWSSYPLQEIEGSALRHGIPRYSALDPEFNAVRESPDFILGSDLAHCGDGLYYEYQAGNGGGTRIAYDRRDRRAYVFSSIR